jgi:hypothetical protein
MSFEQMQAKLVEMQQETRAASERLSKQSGRGILDFPDMKPIGLFSQDRARIEDPGHAAD